MLLVSGGEIMDKLTKLRLDGLKRETDLLRRQLYEEKYGRKRLSI